MEQIRAAHLRVEVWSNAAQPLVVVAWHSMRDLACFMRRKSDAAGEGGRVNTEVTTR